MLEWIVTDNDVFHWIDLKELGDRYISSFIHPRPRGYEIGLPNNHRIIRDEYISLPTTDAIFIESLPYLMGKRVLCQSGSPLAHLCVAAYESGR